MYDVRLALTDMAEQLRACRARDGLTLQQLATRCGVAASTIHKIEAQQMVPTVSVLLKIARGLGRRPEELVRDRYREGGAAAAGAGSATSRPTKAAASPTAGVDGGAEEAAYFDRGIGAWRIDHARGEGRGVISLDPGQRAILIIERGQAEFSGHRVRTRLGCGECLEVRGEQFNLSSEPDDPAAVLVIASPAGRLAEVLGPPNAAPRPHPRSSQKDAASAARGSSRRGIHPAGG